MIKGKPDNLGLLPYLGGLQAAGKLGAAGGKYARKWIKNKYNAYLNRKRTSGYRSNNGVVTQQHDIVNRYKRRPASRRVRRYKKRAFKRFQRLLTRNYPIGRAFRSYFGKINCAVHKIAYLSVIQNSYGGNAQFECDDLYQIAAQLVSAGVADYNGVTGNINNLEMKIMGCRTEITLLADSSNTAPLIISLYYLYCKKDVPATVSSTLLGLISVGFSSIRENVDDPAGGGMALAAYDDWNMDPFGSSLFGEYFTVSQVKELKLSPGQSSDIVLKGRSLGTVDGSTLEGFGGVPTFSFKKGNSSGLLVRIQGSPTGNVASPATLAGQLNYTVAKTYKYQHPDGNPVPLQMTV